MQFQSCRRNRRRFLGTFLNHFNIQTVLHNDYGNVIHESLDRVKQKREKMDVKELLVKGLCSTPKYIDMSCRYDKQGSIYDDQCQDIEDFYHYKAEEAIMRCNAKVHAKIDVQSILVSFLLLKKDIQACDSSMLSKKLILR